jgi:hypothetical protein
MRGCLATSHARHGGICRLHSSGVSGRFYCSSRVNNNSNTQPHAWLQMDRASVLSRPVLPLTYHGNVVRGVTLLQRQALGGSSPTQATVSPSLDWLWWAFGLMHGQRANAKSSQF